MSVYQRWIGIGCLVLGAWSLAAAATGPDAAIALYQQGRLTEARRALLAYVQANPQGTDGRRARVFAALSALKLRDYAAFTQEAQALRQQGSLAPTLTAELDYGQAIMPSYRGQWAAARPALERFIAEYPGTTQAAQAQYDLAYLPRRQGQWDEAKLALSQFIAAHPNTLRADQARLDRAIIAFDFGEETTFTQLANSFLTRRLDADPELRLEMEYRKALFPRTKGRLEEAKAALEKFVAVHPTSAQALNAQYEIAYLPRRQGRWDEAQAALSKFVAEHPGTGQADQAQADLAIMMFDFGQETTFTQTVDQFLAQRPDAAPDLRLDLELRKGLMLRNKGKWDQAAPFFDAFAAAHPDTDAAAQAQFELVKASFNKGDFTDFQRRVEALQSQTNQGPYKMQLEMKYYQALLPRMQGNFETSRAELEKLAAANPNSQGGLEAEFRSVILAHEQGDWDGFRKGALAFRKAHPDMKADWQDQLAFGLAMIPYKQGKWSEAELSLGRLVKSGTLGTNHQAWATREYAKALMQSARQQAGNPQKAQALERQGRALLGDLITSVTAVLPQKRGFDRQFMENVLVDALYSKGDYAGLIKTAHSFLAEHPKPTREWAADLLWIGMAKVSMSPPDLAGAAAAFREIVDAPVVDTQREDHIPSKAAYWGALVAQRQGDEPALQDNLDKLRTKMPDGPIKQAALSRFGAAAQK